MISQYSNQPFPNAAIDVGTNTIKLLIGSITNGRLIRLVKKREVTRLGNGLTEHGILNKGSIIRSISTLNRFKALIEQYKSISTTAVGTSALRDAQNSLQFVETVKEQTGINLTIISGNMEAELTEKGVLGYRDSPATPVFIADIGGGSTEWTIHGNNLDRKRSSIQIGAVRLYEQFIRRDPPTPSEIWNMTSHIVESVKRSFLKNKISFKPDMEEIGSFVATGGTAVTVASLDMGLDYYDGDKIHLHKLSFAKLDELYKQLSAMSWQDRVDVKGMEPERADIIIPGMVILHVLMELLNADTLITSDYGLLEGILLNVEKTIL